MKFFRCSPCRILLCFVLAALLSALWISWQRNQAERASDTVEMVYDYDNVMDTAALEIPRPDSCLIIQKERNHLIGSL